MDGLGVGSEIEFVCLNYFLWFEVFVIEGRVGKLVEEDC